jgi:hypothetical protein
MPQTAIQTARIANGKIGELLVELELTARGWHVERLDGSSKAANGDLIAIKGRQRLVVQVKTNGTQPGRAFLGYAGPFLNDGRNFFNGKDAPIESDIVVSVTGGIRDPKFFVFKVAEAEAYARRDAIQWADVPTREDKPRSVNFPVSPRVTDLGEFRDRWDKLEI